jgi:hypothetical protein
MKLLKRFKGVCLFLIVALVFSCVGVIGAFADTTTESKAKTFSSEINPFEYYPNPENNLWLESASNIAEAKDGVEVFLPGESIEAWGYGAAFTEDGEEFSYEPVYYEITNTKTRAEEGHYLVESDDKYYFKLNKTGRYEINCLFYVEDENGAVVVDSKGEEYMDIRTITFDIVPKASSIVPTIKKITPSKKKMNVTWKKVKDVSKYQIQYRAKGSKKWITKTASSSASSATIKKLKPKKEYQVRIRSCVTISGKNYYSAWSKTKTSKKIKAK